MQVLQRRLRRVAEEVKSMAAEDVKALAAAGGTARAGAQLFPAGQLLVSEMQVHSDSQPLNSRCRALLMVLSRP